MLFATAKGQIKKSELAEYSVRKQRFAAIGLKNGDRLLSVTRISGGESLLMVTKLGMAIHFSLHDVACIGRTAAVMLGSTETTFYVLAVYFGACGIRHSRWAIPAAIVADVTGFVTAAALVRCLWGT